MLKKFTLLVLVVLFASACSVYRINSEETSANLYLPKDKANIVYIENVTQPHEVIGYVSVRTERRHTLDEVIERMKREAAIAGGDALTNIAVDTKGSYIRAKYTAAIIAFK